MTRNLDAWFIDRDGSRIGHALWESFGNVSTTRPQLGWRYVDPADFGTNDDVAQAIIAEKAWIAVVGEPGVLRITRRVLMTVIICSPNECNVEPCFGSRTWR